MHTQRTQTRVGLTRATGRVSNVARRQADGARCAREQSMHVRYEPTQPAHRRAKPAAAAGLANIMLQPVNLAGLGVCRLALVPTEGRPLSTRPSTWAQSKGAASSARCRLITATIRVVTDRLLDVGRTPASGNQMQWRRDDKARRWSTSAASGDTGGRH